MEAFGSWKPPKYPRVHYLARRDHWEAAINWYREQVAAGEEQRAQEESLAEEQKRRQAHREAEEQRLEELRRRPFDDVREEVLQDLVTPGSELNRFFRQWVDPEVPRDLQLRALDQRAKAEACRLRSEEPPPFARGKVFTGHAPLTDAELDLLNWEELPAAS